MREQIRSFVSVLERDPDNEEAILGLEELVTGENADESRPEIAEELKEGRQRLMHKSRFEASCKLIEMEFAVAADQAQEAELLREQARVFNEELFDQQSALEVLRKLQEAYPENEEISRKVEAIEAEREKWQELVQKFVEQAEETTDPALKAHMLYSAAERTYKNNRDSEEILKLLNQALDSDPAHLKTSRLTEKVLKEQQQWEQLAELYVKLANHRRSKDERVQMYLAAAYTHAYRLEDADSAAIIYTDVMDLVPGQSTAMKFLVQYYEEREDWDHLVAVYEDALRGKLTREDELAMLMQVGMVHWRMRDDLDAAEEYFRRLRRLDATHSGMLNFYRKYTEKTGDKSKLVQILSDAARLSDDKKVKDKLTKEVAQLAAEEGGNVEKAIDAWKSVMRKEPENQEARDELKRLYQQSKKWNALLDLLKGEADLLAHDDVAGKVAIYEEVVRIYRDHLSLTTMVINTYKTILGLQPENQSAQKELIEIYDKEGRWNDLVNILNTRAQATEDTEEKIGLLNRMAQIWIDQFNNFNRAMGPLEEILALEPTNHQAIETLKKVYLKRRAWRPLLELLEREVDFLEGEAKRDRLVEMARLAADRLSDYAKAIELWRAALEIDPETPEALTQLERLTERQKDWAGLCDVIELRVEKSTNGEESVALLTKLGMVAKERVKDPARSAIAWQRVLELQPGHAKAMRSLKEAYLAAENWEALETLYQEANDYEGLVEVLGTTADRIGDLETKKMLSFRCAELYDDPIGQSDRAVRHYERVLSVEPKNERAARALAPIYRRMEKWNRLLGVLNIVLDYTTEAEERVGLMNEMRAIAVEQMNNRLLAFEWAAKAYNELPHDTEVRAALEEMAESAGRYDELLDIYKKRIDEFEGQEQIDLKRHIAEIALDRLARVDDAVEGYRDILKSNPGDAQALQALDQIFRSTARWEDLVDVFKQRIELAADEQEKRDLMIEMARLFEDGMDDPENAKTHYFAALELSPDDEEVLQALERIARLTEKWDDLADILQRRRDMPEIGEDEWREVSFGLAALLDEHLLEKEKSITIYEELLKRYPEDASISEAMEHFLKDEEVRVQVAEILEPHLITQQNWRRLAWVLAILIEATKKKKPRLKLQMRLAEIYGTELDDQRLAYETLGAALRENPTNTTLWSRMTDQATTLDLLSDLAERLSEAYNSGKLKPAQEAALAGRLADILDAKLSRPDEAEVYHRKVLEVDPASESSFDSLVNLYTQAERWQDLLGLYRQVLAGEASVHPPLELQLKICFILDEVLHDVPEAITAYREVLDKLDPGNGQAVRALATLYEEAERWEDLSDLLQVQLEQASDEESGVLRFRLGEIAERFLERPQDALEHYEQVLVEDANHLKAQEALERLIEMPELRQRAAQVLEHTYEQQGAAEPLTRVLMVELEQEELNSEKRVEILMRVADLRERRLSDPHGAFQAYSDAFLANPNNESARDELARLAGEHALFEEYARVLDQAIPMVEDDIALAGQLISEVARLYDEQIADPGNAEFSYRRLLKLDPTNPDTALRAIEALDRILTSGESWKDLLEILRAKVEMVQDPAEQIEILHRMAEIEESVLERTAKAIDIFQEVLGVDETDQRALFGLERLYEREEGWADLIEVLRKRSIIEEDPEQRRELLFRVAQLYEERLADLDEAIAAYNEVNDEVGPNRPSLDALTRLYRSTERWKDLLDVYERTEPLIEDQAERAMLLYNMSELLYAKLSDPEQAVQKLGETLDTDVGYPQARTLLETMLESPVKLDAIEILRPIYDNEGNFEQLLKLDQIEAGETDDPVERSKIHRHAAEVAEMGLSQPERAFEFLCRAFRDGAAAPDLNSLIDELERLAEPVNGHQELIDCYREVGPDILDADLQVRCYLRIGEISMSTLENHDLAREYYVKVLDMDGENAQGMDALEQIYETTEQYPELFEIYRRKAQIVLDDADRRSILFKQARICEEKLEDVSGATTTYETILESDVENHEAMAALERLYPQSERWTDLMNLLERRVDLDPSGSVDLLHRLGTLSKEKLGDDERAFDYYRRALEIDSHHQETLVSLEGAMDDEAQRGRVAEILEPVYKARGDWTKLVEALSARSEYCDDPGERKELLGRIGGLYEEQLGDLENAFLTFGRLFKQDIEDKKSWEILSRLASVLEAWDRLAVVYAEALDDVVGDTPTTAELAYNLGEIYEYKLGELDKAKDAYRRTLVFSPEDEHAFNAVERTLLATEAWLDLLELYREASDTAMDSDKRKEFIFKIAEMQEASIKDLDASIDAYQDILNIDQQDAQAIDSLNRLYEKTGRYEDLAMHLRTQIDNTAEATGRNGLRCRLGQVFEENLEDLSSAVDTYEEALQEEAGGIIDALAALERLILREEQQQRIAEILEPLYRTEDEWKKLVVILQTQIKYTDNEIDKVSKYKEIASLQETRGGNFMLSFEALAGSWEVDPSDRESLNELVRLADQIGNWDELAKLVEKSLEDIFDLELKIEVLRLLASTYDHKLDVPRKAITAYRNVLEINDFDAEALDALEGLYNLVGDWTGLVGVLAQKANIATTPEEQAELLRTKASIFEDLLSSTGDAIEAYCQALDAEPTSTVTMDALERLYEAAEQWTELIEIKRQRLDITTELDQRLEILRNIAVINEKQIEDTFEAINGWRAVLDESNQDVAAIEALDRLYTKESMFHELLDNLRLQKEITADQANRVELSCRIGALQEKELSDLDGAVQSFEDVLAQQPTHSEAIASLERLANDQSVRAKAIDVLEPLHRDAGRWDRLGALLELKLEILEEPLERLENLLALAELHEVGESELMKAFDVYARALAEDPSRLETMEALERIAGTENAWDALADCYHKQSQEVYDVQIERTLLIRLGEMRERHLNDAKGAIDAYRGAVDTGEADNEVYAALDRLYERESMWPELDEILDREIEIAPGIPEINELKLRQGIIREREFKDTAGAISAFKDVVEADSANDKAVQSLEALLDQDEFVQDIVEVLAPVYEQRGEKEKIGTLFENRLRVVDGDADRVDLFRELAMHQEETIGDLNAAFEAYAQAFVIDPAEATLLDEMERLAGELGAWVSLVETVEKVLGDEDFDPLTVVELGLKVAKWAASNVGDPHKAEALYRMVLDKQPDHQDALAALEELLRELGRFDDLLPIMKRRAEAIYDFGSKKELYIAIAQIAQSELSDIPEAIAAYQAIRELDDADLDALDALITLTEGQSDFPTLIELLLARATYTTEADEANSFRRNAANLILQHLDDAPRAADVYREILDMNPTDEDASRQLETLYERLEQWSDLRELFMQRLDNAQGDADRITVHEQLATLFEKHFDAPEDAIEQLREILMLDPQADGAARGLERLYTKTEQWQDLVELLEGRADHAREAGDSNAELEWLTRAGEIWDERLLDTEQATSIYERVLERDSEHTRALAALARLYEAKEDWEQCAAILRRAASAGRGGPDEAEVHYRLAMLHEKQMDDKPGAVEELRQAVNIYPGHQQANQALADYSREQGDFPGLLDALIREEQYLEEPKDKVVKLVEIAKLQADHLQDDAGAVSALERAREIGADNKDVLLLLSDAYIRADRQDDAIPVIESLIDAETGGGKRRSKEAAVYHHRLAEAYLKRGERAKALENLEAAYKLNIANVEVLVSLGKLHYENEDFDKAVKLFRALLLQRLDPNLGVSKADIYWYVGDISLKQGDTRKAKGMFQRGLDDNGSHEGCKDGLARC